jgi:predicted TIM-barrel fold metal-dependent hydrolase
MVIDPCKFFAVNDPINDPSFFFYDLSICYISSGHQDLKEIEQYTGITINTIADLKNAYRKMYDVAASKAKIKSIKTNHAYWRTLDWKPRTDAEAQTALDVYKAKNKSGWEVNDDAIRLTLGDWSLKFFVDFAAEKQIPFKIHTGILYGTFAYGIDDIRKIELENTNVSKLGKLVRSNQFTKFVLMHGSYPYSQDFITFCKTFTNVWAELSWIYVANPSYAEQTLTDVLNGIPTNKILAFGADHIYPAICYGIQKLSREIIYRGLNKYMENTGYSLAKMKWIADRILVQNARELYGY